MKVLYVYHTNSPHFLKGNFVYENYCQALKHIKEDGERLASLEAALGLTCLDYEAFLKAEREYLIGLQSEPNEVACMADYMELLFKLQKAE